MIPPSTKPAPRCKYCNTEGHIEKNCFKKQMDQKGAKEETRLQEQRPFSPSDPPPTKFSSRKCRRIRDNKQIAALALKLSQKHLAQVKESNRLELTASTASGSYPRAGRRTSTTNKQSKLPSKADQIGLKNIVLGA